MKRGLGRGIDSLLPGAPPQATTDGGPSTVPVDRIDPNPNQPRRTFDEGELRELSSSIATLGLLQPLLVRRSGDRYELIAGERRLRASKLAGLDAVPVVVVDTDDRGSLERALVENIHRADLNPIEEAAAYKQLIEDGGLTHEALAQRLGRSRVTITNALRLLELPTALQAYVTEGRMSGAHGKALLGLQGNPMQDRIARRVVQTGMSVRETEEIVRRYQMMTGAATETSPRTRTLSAAATDAQSRLSSRLQTRVRVEMGKRKGRVVIDFSSEEDLARLVETIEGEEPRPELRAAPDPF